MKQNREYHGSYYPDQNYSGIIFVIYGRQVKGEYTNDVSIICRDCKITTGTHRTYPNGDTINNGIYTPFNLTSLNDSIININTPIMKFCRCINDTYRETIIQIITII